MTKSAQTGRALLPERIPRGPRRPVITRGEHRAARRAGHRGARGGGWGAGGGRERPRGRGPTRAFGKALVQSMFLLPAGDRVLLTIARALTLDQPARLLGTAPSSADVAMLSVKRANPARQVTRIKVAERGRRRCRQARDHA